LEFKSKVIEPYTSETDRRHLFTAWELIYPDQPVPPIPSAKWKEMLGFESMNPENDLVQPYAKFTLFCLIVFGQYHNFFFMLRAIAQKKNISFIKEIMCALDIIFILLGWLNEPPYPNGSWPITTHRLMLLLFPHQFFVVPDNFNNLQILFSEAQNNFYKLFIHIVAIMGNVWRDNPPLSDYTSLYLEQTIKFLRTINSTFILDRYLLEYYHLDTAAMNNLIFQIWFTNNIPPFVLPYQPDIVLHTVLTEVANQLRMDTTTWIVFSTSGVRIVDFQCTLGSLDSKAIYLLPQGMEPIFGLLLPQKD